VARVNPFHSTKYILACSWSAIIFMFSVWVGLGTTFFREPKTVFFTLPVNLKQTLQYVCTSSISIDRFCKRHSDLNQNLPEFPLLSSAIYRQFF
jgi:hypothetical protein